MRKDKGITLVALIITIVVMLILVAVSVNVLIKSDLMGIAEKTTDKYKTAAQEESKGGAIEINGKKYNSIEDYTSSTHNFVKNGVEVNCSHCDLSLNIGQEVKYKDNGAATTTITAEKTGYTSDQTLEKGTDVKWVVLGAKDEDNDGRNETLLITTVEPTENSIIWGSGENAYNNGEAELNRMCKELYGDKARSITLDDINSALGYKPKGGEYIKVNENNENVFSTTGNYTTKLKELEIWDDIKSCTVGSNGDTAEKYADYIYNGCYYSVDTNGNIRNDFENQDKNELIQENQQLQGKASEDTSKAKIMRTAVIRYHGNVPIITRDIIFGTGNTYNYSLASKIISAGCYSFSSTSVSKSVSFELASIGRGVIGSNTFGAVMSRLNNSSESTIRDVSMNDVSSRIKTVSLMHTALNSGYKINRAQYTSNLRPIITLTDEIPELGEVITQYGAGSSSIGNEETILQ